MQVVFRHAIIILMEKIQEEQNMKLYLIRHGETDYNKMKRNQGQIDIPLNEYGRETGRKDERRTCGGAV